MEETNIRKTELYVPPIVSSTGLTPKGLYFTIPEAFREETHRNIENECAHWRNPVSNPLVGALYRIRKIEDGKGINNIGWNTALKVSTPGILLSIQITAGDVTVGGPLMFNTLYNINNRTTPTYFMAWGGSNFRYHLINARHQFRLVSPTGKTGAVGGNPFYLKCSYDDFWCGTDTSDQVTALWSTNPASLNRQIWYLSE